MKVLKKFKFINWYLFQNITIDIEGDTVLTGNNGCGKSTVVDALQYLLVGGKRFSKFNSATDDKSKRTLESYVRGNTGITKQPYIRGGDVISHICLEFYDQQTEKSAMVGVIITLSENNTLTEKFYILENAQIEEDFFVTGNKPNNLKEVNDYLRLTSRKLETLDHTPYRTKLGQYLGLDIDKYSKLLPKAIAVKDMNIKKFIYDFFLDSQQPDIKPLKDNVANLKKIEAQIKNDTKKIDSLEKIIEPYKEWEKLDTNIEKYALVEKIANIAGSDQLIKENKDKIEEQQNVIKDLKNRRDTITEKILNLENEIESLTLASNNTTNASAINDINKQIQNKLTRLEAEKNDITYIKNAIDGEVELYSKIKERIKSKNVDSFISYWNTNRDNANSKDIIAGLSTIKSDLETFRDIIYKEHSSYSEQSNKLSDELNMIQERIRQTNQNSIVAPSDVTDLVDILRNELSRTYNEEVDVYPLYKLIDILDESWRNAVEGVLAGSRFDIIVNPKYFKEAANIFARLSKSRDYRSGIVDAAKFRQYDLDPNSLAAKIKVEHPYAKVFVYSHLNNVICVDKVEDLNSYQRSVTKDCITYFNYTVRKINSRVYENPVIGTGATKINLEKDKADLDIKSKKFAEVHQLLINVQQDKLTLAGSKLDQISENDRLFSLDNIGQTKSEIISLEQQLEEYQKDKNVAKLSESIGRKKQEKANLENEKNSLISQIGWAENKIDSLNRLVSETESQKGDSTAQVEAITSSKPELYSNSTVLFDELNQFHKNNILKILANVQNEVNKFKKSKDNLSSTIIVEMKDYNKKHSFNGIPDFEHVQSYVDEYAKLKDNDITNFKSQAERLRTECEDIFKNDFLSKLRHYIMTAQTQISELNHSLSEKWFNDDRYAIECSPSLDPSYEAYYKLIMNRNVVEKNQSYVADLNKEEEEILQKLFEEISSIEPEYESVAADKLDYRNYLNFMIEVTSKNGQVIKLDSNIGEKSGGEQQSPFYILIAACFEQLLIRNKKISSGCIVLFDEAFNKMDNIRIRALLDYYKTLSFQVIISIPSNKLNDLRGFMKTYLVVAQEKNVRASIGYFDDTTPKAIF